jgi:hypothetical protein
VVPALSASRRYLQPMTTSFPVPWAASIVSIASSIWLGSIAPSSSRAPVRYHDVRSD